MSTYKERLNSLEPDRLADELVISEDQAEKVLKSWNRPKIEDPDELRRAALAASNHDKEVGTLRAYLRAGIDTAEEFGDGYNESVDRYNQLSADFKARTHDQSNGLDQDQTPAATGASDDDKDTAYRDNRTDTR